MREQQLKWYTRLFVAFVVSSILFLMIWVFSQFKEPPGFSVLMNSLLLLMAFVCLESIRFTQRSVLTWNFERIPYLKNALAFVAPVLVGTLVYTVLFYFFKWFDHYLLGSEPPFLPHMISAVLIGLLLSLIFGLVLWVVTWKDSYYKAILANEAYKTEIVNANLHTLRNQLDPHFLFNNFNTIYYLVDENPEMAKKFLKNVSDIYRHILKHSKEHLIPVTEEYKVTLQYLEVLKERFGEAFQLKNEVKQNHLKEKHIPPLVLHELVENVIKHNQIDAANAIVLKLLSTEGYLTLSNTLNPKKVGYSTKNGLHNILTRYDLLTELEVKVESSEDCFSVQIPLITINDEN